MPALVRVRVRETETVRVRETETVRLWRPSQSSLQGELKAPAWDAEDLAPAWDAEDLASSPPPPPPTLRQNRPHLSSVPT
jgi:hypothetical protein